MKQIYPDLWITEPELQTRKDKSTLKLHGFLIKRPDGNVLFSRCENPSDHDSIDRKGGLVRHYLTHWHEAGPGLVIIKERFASLLGCHQLAKPKVSEFVIPDFTFERPGTHLGDIQILPAPGHTPGSTIYIYHSPHGKRYLFAGDTMTICDGRWQTVLGTESDESQLRVTLSSLRSLNPDVVLFSTTVGSPSFRELSAFEWKEALDEAAASPFNVC